MPCHSRFIGLGITKGSFFVTASDRSIDSSRRLDLLIIVFLTMQLLVALALMAAVSATVSSVITWVIVRSALVCQPKKAVRTDGDCDDEPETICVDTTTSLYLSSSGEKLHMYKSCIGRFSRVKVHEICVTCARKYANRSSSKRG